jgi:hypothetical protein
MGLTKKVQKLEAFLQTWDLPGQNSCADIEQLSDRIGSIVTIPAKELESRRDELVWAALANSEALFKSTGLMPTDSGPLATFNEKRKDSKQEVPLP